MMSRRHWPDTLELQDRLNTNLLQGRKSAILLNKHIRKLKSVKAYVLNEKDKVKTELNDYVNKLLESLLDFKSEMLQQLDDVVKTKVEELSMMKTALEEDIDTLSTLCDETEKLLQFDSEISTYMDLHRAETLEKAFRMLRNQDEVLELGEIMNLKFEPTVDVDHLSSQAFGTLYPSLNGNGSSEELPGTSSNHVLRNLNCNKSIVDSRNKTSDIQPAHTIQYCDTGNNMSVSANINLGRMVQTDINSNLIPNFSQPNSETNQIPNLDVSGLAAYINELNCVQASNNLAFLISQFPSLQSVPLLQDQPMPAVTKPVAAETISLPEGPPQPRTETVPAQNISLSDRKSKSASVGLPLETSSVVDSVTTVRENTPPPPGFIPPSLKGEDNEQHEGNCAKDLQVTEKLESLPDNVTCEKVQQSKLIKSNLDEELLKSVKTEQEQKSKCYIREAKLDISGLGINKDESKNTTASKESLESVAGLANDKSKSNEISIDDSKDVLPQKYSNLAGVVHSESDTSPGSKLERSLNDLEYSSDEELDAAAGGKDEPEIMSLSNVADKEIENQNRSVKNHTEVVDSASPDLDVAVQNVGSCKVSECGIKQKVGLMDPEVNTLTSENNSRTEKTFIKTNTNLLRDDRKIEEAKIEEGNENKHEKAISETEILLKKVLPVEQIHVVPNKPLRRPMSLPKIALKTQNCSLFSNENRGILQSREDKSEGSLKNANMMKEKSEELWDASDNTEFLAVNKNMVHKKDDTEDFSQTDKAKQTLNVFSPVVMKTESDKDIQEKFSAVAMKDDMPGSKICAKWHDVHTDNRASETNEDTNVIQVETVTENKSPAKASPEKTLPKREKISKASERRNASERNIDCLISQASWCKKYIQKTLSPITKKKTEKNNNEKTELIDQTKSEENKQEHIDVQSNAKAETFMAGTGKFGSANQNLSELPDSKRFRSSSSSSSNNLPSASFTSESWDLELENECKTAQNNQTEQSVNSNSCLTSFPNQNNMIPQLHSTLSNQTSQQNVKKETNNLNTEETAVSKTVATESWDLEIESANYQNESKKLFNGNKQQCEQTDVREDVQNPPVTVSCEKETAVNRTVRTFQSFSTSSVLENYRTGSQTDAIKGRHLASVGSMGKGSSKGLYYPIGVTSNSFGDIIVTDTGNHLIKVYDSNGVFVKTIGQQCSPPLRRPSAAVVNDRDELFVRDDLCIRKFERTGRHVCDIGYRHFIKPFGLALTSEGVLIVLETHYQHPSLIHMFQDGSTIMKFPYQPLQRAPPNSKCRFLAVSGNTVIVSDLGLSKVYITDLHGYLQRVIGQYGRCPAEFCEPSGVAVDTFGNFVIGDSKSNKIKVWQCDGTFLGVVQLSDMVVRPSGVHLTSDNRLLISNYLHHQVKVYQLELK